MFYYSKKRREIFNKKISLRTKKELGYTSNFPINSTWKDIMRYTFQNNDIVLFGFRLVWWNYGKTIKFQKL